MSYKLEFADVLAQWPLFAQGAWMTIQLSAYAVVLGFVIGTLCAIGRRSRYRYLSLACGAYVEAVRNTPLLIQIFIVFFGLSSAGIKIPAFAAALIALVLNVGAYTCEIMRAGMDAIHKGQIEAAECLGLRRGQIYWHVILRPAMEKVDPALTSQFILLMLASSITSQIGVEELTAVANRVQSDTYRSFESFIVVAIIYIALSWIMRCGFWAIGQLVFTRRRKLGTFA